jgi:hypothetical protein
MPAFGLIPDSPLFYYGGKASRTLRRGGGSGGRGSANTKVLITFKGLVLYKPVLHYELNVPAGMVGRYMGKLGNKIKVGAQARVGVRTGLLRASIHVSQGMSSGKQYVKVGSSVSYAFMHHEGTRPHIIAAKPPGVLRFTSRKGGVVHASTVMHPGTKPNRYLGSQLRRHIR